MPDEQLVVIRAGHHCTACAYMRKTRSHHSEDAGEPTPARCPDCDGPVDDLVFHPVTGELCRRQEFGDRARVTVGRWRPRPPVRADVP